MSLRLFSSFVIKTKNPCLTCVNYVAHKYGNPYDEIYAYKTKLGKCSLFKKQNLVTGEVEHDVAISCRTDESKCGVEGRFHRLPKQGSQITPR